MAPNYDSLIIRSRVFDATQAAQKKAFLSALEQVATVAVAAKLVGIDRSTIYRWRDDDKDFAEQWDSAIALAFEGLESATYLKLAKGLQNTQQRISMPEAKLIEMFLAGAKPEKYRQRGVEINNSNAVELGVTIDWSSVPDDVMLQFNQGQLTLQDVYDRTLQVKRQDQPEPSADRRDEGSG